MKKSKIRLTESQLHNVIRESVKRVLREIAEPSDIYDMALDVIESNSYDMEDEFSAEEIAQKVAEIVQNAMKINYDFLWDNYQVRVHNTRSGSFISFSCDEDDRGTGVSERSMTYLIHPYDDVDEYDIENVISSLNEAWYQCNLVEDEDEWDDDEEW